MNTGYIDATFAAAALFLWLRSIMGIVLSVCARFRFLPVWGVRERYWPCTGTAVEAIYARKMASTGTEKPRARTLKTSEHTCNGVSSLLL